MSKGPGLFSEIGKKARDLLAKDYISDQKLSILTYSDTGVALASTAVKKGELSSGDVGAQYKYKNTLIDVKVETGSSISTTHSKWHCPLNKNHCLSEIPDYSSGKGKLILCYDYDPLMEIVEFSKLKLEFGCKCN